MAKICKNNIFRLFIGGLLRIAEEGELKAKMQSLHGWSDKEYGEYLNIFIEKWNSIPDDTLTEEDNKAWVAVDSLNRELIFRNEPFRDIDTDYMITYHGWFDRNMNSWGIELPKGSIKKLIGRDLDWSNEPVELKEE